VWFPGADLLHAQQLSEQMTDAGGGQQTLRHLHLAVGQGDQRRTGRGQRPEAVRDVRVPGQVTEPVEDVRGGVLHGPVEPVLPAEQAHEDSPGHVGERGGVVLEDEGEAVAEGGEPRRGQPGRSADRGEGGLQGAQVGEVSLTSKTRVDGTPRR
jgi:hypothetical protein